MFFERVAIAMADGISKAAAVAMAVERVTLFCRRTGAAWPEDPGVSPLFYM
jgi:hypothetical protein